jgi:hypothetical protein
MNFTAVVRFSRNGEFENADTFHGVEIPDDTKEDDEVEAILDAIRPEIQDMFEGDDDFEDGNISWELFEWNKE